MFKKGKSLLIILLIVIFTTITFYAKNSYTVTFDKGFDSSNRYIEVIVDEGDLVVMIDEPAIEGYNFLGWFLSDVLYDFNTPINSDLTLYAKYELITYNITYILYDDIPNDPAEYIPLYEEFTVESVITLNSPSDRVSATFSGWYLNSEYTGDLVEVISGNYTSDLTLYAKWDKKTHNVKFIVDEVVIKELDIYHSEPITNFPVDPVKEGFIFYGWTDNDGVFVNELTPVNASMVLYPAFAESVTVTFTDEFNDEFLIEIIKGERLSPIPLPEKEHYLFDGWYDGGVEFDFSLPIYENITLTASWISKLEVTKLNLTNDLNDYTQNIDEPLLLLTSKVTELIATVTLENYINYEALKTSFKEELFNLVLNYFLQIYDDYYQSLDPYILKLEPMYNYYRDRINNITNIEEIKSFTNTAITHISYQYNSLLLIDESKAIVNNLMNSLNSEDVNAELVLFVDNAIPTFDSLNSDALVVSYFNYLINKILNDSLNIYINDILNPVNYLNDLISDKVNSLTDLYEVDFLLFINEVKEELLLLERLEVIKTLNTYKDDISDKVQVIIDEYIMLINSEENIFNIKDVLYEGELKIIKRMSLDNSYNEILVRHYELLNYESHYYRDSEKLELNNIIDNLINDYDSNLITTKSLETALNSLENVLRYYTDNRIRTDLSIVPEPYEAEGYASSLLGFNKGERLIVNLVESYYVRDLNLKKIIKNKNIVDKSLNRTNKELKNFLKSKRIINYFDIYIIDNDENEVDYKMKMEINLFVPEFLYERPNLSVIYIKDGLIEVYEIDKSDGWISFEVDHFSGFYFITDRKTSFSDYWWIVALSITLAASLTGGGFYLYIKYKKEKEKVID